MKKLYLITFLLMVFAMTATAQNKSKEIAKDDYLNSYLTVESLADNNTIKLYFPEHLNAEQLAWVAYSTDGNSWTIVEVDGTEKEKHILLNQGEKVYLKGSGKQCDTLVDGYWYNFSLLGTAEHEVYGNIMSLLYGDDFATQTAFPEGSTNTFGFLFFDDAYLVSAENLMLPATELAPGCYYGMFAFCTALPAACEMHVTTVDRYSCYCMYYNCYALAAACELPATTMAPNCYGYMFADCTALTEAPALPATQLADSCYYTMFAGCVSLTAAPELSATTLTRNCYENMFYYCPSLIEAPELPATTLADGCYKGMFGICTSLTKAPELRAPVLTEECYSIMFEQCTELHELVCLATDISAEGCTSEWFIDGSTSGTFYKAPEMEDWPLNSIDGIPTGWTVANYDGVDDQQDQEVAIYPNPVVDKLHINGKNIQSVKVFDLNGRLVHSQDCDRVDQIEVDFQGCAEGVYTVSIQSEHGNATRKVVY